MTRDGFMKELAYLLQDIQDEDKEDALQYYICLLYTSQYS